MVSTNTLSVMIEALRVMSSVSCAFASALITSALCINVKNAVCMFCSISTLVGRHLSASFLIRGSSDAAMYDLLTQLVSAVIVVIGFLSKCSCWSRSLAGPVIFSSAQLTAYSSVTPCVWLAF